MADKGLFSLKGKRLTHVPTLAGDTRWRGGQIHFRERETRLLLTFPTNSPPAWKVRDKSPFKASRGRLRWPRVFGGTDEDESRWFQIMDLAQIWYNLPPCAEDCDSWGSINERGCDDCAARRPRKDR